MPCILVIYSLLTESVHHQTKHLEFGPPFCKEDLLWTGGSQVITLVGCKSMRLRPTGLEGVPDSIDAQFLHYDCIIIGSVKIVI